jgi:hypothetical protein
MWAKNVFSMNSLSSRYFASAATASSAAANASRTVRQRRLWPYVLVAGIGAWGTYDVATAYQEYQKDVTPGRITEIWNKFSEDALKGLKDPKVTKAFGGEVTPLKAAQLQVTEKGTWRIAYNSWRTDPNSYLFSVGLVQYIPEVQISLPVQGKKATGRIILDVIHDEHAWKRKKMQYMLADDVKPPSKPSSNSTSSSSSPSLIACHSVLDVGPEESMKPLDGEGIPFRYEIKKFW